MPLAIQSNIARHNVFDPCLCKCLCACRQWLSDRRTDGQMDVRTADRQTDVLFDVYNSVHVIQNNLQYNVHMLLIILAFLQTEPPPKYKKH